MALLVETSLASGRDILRGIARYVREHQHWSLFLEPQGFEELEQAAVRWLKQWRGDGVIVRVRNAAIGRAVLESGLPAVDVLGMLPQLGLPLVNADDVRIGELGAEHLLERGFRRFGFVGIEGRSWSQNRRDGFVARVRSAGCDAQTFDLPFGVATSLEPVQEALATWLLQLAKPAAVMVCSDQRGPQFFDACQRAGVQAPDDIAVIGVEDDQPLCEVCDPPLSSIDANQERAGYEAAALLDRLMASRVRPVKPIHVRVPPLGVVTRLSSDVTAIKDRSLSLALRVIRERACEGVSIDELARLCGMSRSVLQRRFRSTFDRSVHQHILDARLKRARELLEQTDVPLEDVAERCGFRHQEYMGVVFRRRVGVTPGQYRREARGPALRVGRAERVELARRKAGRR